VTPEHGPRRKRILVFNQYYWPGIEATAHLLSELCEELAADFEVTVVTGRLRDRAEKPGRTVHNGVEIVRVASTMFDRAQLGPRAINYATFLAAALRAGFSADRPDVVLCMTDPPIIGSVALPVARRFRARLVVISQDVFPEIAVELRRLEQPMLVTLLRRMIAFYLQRADRVVAIGETMRERLEAKGVRADKLIVIPNWVDTSSVTPMPRDNPWACDHGLDDRFVVMHSGNIGHAQGLETLVRAGTFLRDLEELTIAMIGTGARHAAVVEQATRVEADAVRFFPYQPRDAISLSLSSADVHFVGLAEGLAGYVVPSRVYGILAVGRPLIVCADDESETARLVREIGCGLVVPPGRPDLLAQAIREMHGGRHDLERMGELGRAYVLEAGDRRVAVGKYKQLLFELTALEAA